MALRIKEEGLLIETEADLRACHMAAIAATLVGEGYVHVENLKVPAMLEGQAKEIVTKGMAAIALGEGRASQLDLSPEDAGEILTGIYGGSDDAENFVSAVQ
ncbi:MAG: hypothetical protein ACREJM_16295 [Candidatus Saccharimonadales bacterium]